MASIDSAESVEMVRADNLRALPGVWHGFSTRVGGVSTVYDERGDLNLGWTADDEQAAVAKNRRLFVEAVTGSDAERLVTIRQIHSAVSVALGPEELSRDLQTANGRAVLEGDGLMTDVPGVLLGIQTADCVPVLVADPVRRVVAGFHAGWRGTAQAIVEQGVGMMRETYGSRPEDLVAAIGPAIGVCCYSVGDEVRAAFEERFRYGAELFREVGEERRLHVDLAEANRRQLLDAGLSAESIEITGHCTAGARVAGRRQFFSHRDERGVTGRMISVIGLRGVRCKVGNAA